MRFRTLGVKVVGSAFVLSFAFSTGAQDPIPTPTSIDKPAHCSERASAFGFKDFPPKGFVHGQPCPASNGGCGIENV